MNNNEKMVYQTLFDIRFNNKFFTVFIDKFNRRTFLEIDKSGKYIYPTLEDFTMLHRIYNERNIFVMYASKYYDSIYNKIPDHPNARKMTFKEYVRITTGATACVLAGILIGNSLSSVLFGRQLELVREENNLIVTANYVSEALIDNPNELDNILDYKSISKEDVINVINSNENLNDYYKNGIITFLEHIVSKYPNTDMRIFYENMKSLTINEVESDLLPYAAGQYNVIENKITISKDYFLNDEVLYHELAHAYHNLHIGGMMPKYRVETFGYSLEEAMTNKMIEGLVEDPYSYNKEGRVLDYLSSCVQFDYYDYENYGVSKLIELLKTKYPEVDINYIITSLDSMHDTEANTGEFMTLEENKYLLDEIFNICIHNIDINDRTMDVYQPFRDFLKSFNCDKYEELISDYLSKYNDILKCKGCDLDLITDDYRIIKYNEYFSNLRNLFSIHVATLPIDKIQENDIYGPFRRFIVEHDILMTPEKLSSPLSMETVSCDFLDIYNEFLRNNGYNEDNIITREEVKIGLDKYKNLETYENVKPNISLSLETLFDNFEVVIVQNHESLDFHLETRMTEEDKSKLFSYEEKYSSPCIQISFREYVETYLNANENAQSIELKDVLNMEYFKTYIIDKGIVSSEQNISDLTGEQIISLYNGYYRNGYNAGITK